MKCARVPDGNLRRVAFRGPSEQRCAHVNVALSSYSAVRHSFNRLSRGTLLSSGTPPPAVAAVRAGPPS